MGDNIGYAPGMINTLSSNKDDFFASNNDSNGYDPNQYITQTLKMIAAPYKPLVPGFSPETIGLSQANIPEYTKELNDVYSGVSSGQIDYNDALKVPGFNPTYLKTMYGYDPSQNSWQNQYLSPALKGISGLGTLANVWMGFQNLGLAKQQMGLAKEQWGETKQELNRIKQVRKNITMNYIK